jgi:hypothetical protein
LTNPQATRGVTRSFTWAQLGVDGDLLQAIRGEPFVFAAAGPGSTDFHRVDVAGIGGVGTMVLRAADDGFDLVATSAADGVSPKSESAKLVVLHSVDGQAWTANDAAPQGINWVSAVGSIDGRTVVVGSSAHGVLVLVDNASGGWTSIDLTAMLPADGRQKGVGLSSAAVGPFGVVATVTLFDETVAPNGTTPTTAAPKRPTTHVLASRDLTTWSDDSFDSLVGPDVFPNRVVMVGDHVVITASQTGTPAPANAVALVGTPK